MQNFSLIAWKMSEFEILTSEAKVDTKAKAKAEVKTEARYN